MGRGGPGVRQLFFPRSNCRTWSTSGSSEVLERFQPSGRDRLCPSWCAGIHAGSDIGPGRAVIFHGASAIGGGVLAGGQAVTLGMNWAERFEDGMWQLLRGKDVIVFLQAGTEYIAVEATDRNMAGPAVAR